MSDQYLHGFSPEEQKRLVRQAEFLESYVYEGIDLAPVKHLLEVGCGVGAQTKILLRRFPHLKITAVDFSATQLDQAKKYLSEETQQGRVEFVQADAQILDQVLKGSSYDGAFLCWFLEHVPEPLKVLQSMKALLKPKSKVWLTEVNNSSFFVDPYSPALLKYWFEFNDHQWSIRGHPFVGLQLGGLLHQAQYKNIHTEIRSFLFDGRKPDQRREFFAEWTDLLLSAADGLLKSGRVNQKLIDQMKDELNRAKDDPQGVFYYNFVRGTATWS